MRRALLLLLPVAALLAASCARAPIGPYRGPDPAPGAITSFQKYWSPPSRTPTESKAGAPSFIVPGTTDSAQRKIGTLDIPNWGDSVVVLLYGDNRPGFRLMTTPWGLPAVLGAGSSDPRYLVWAFLNIPVTLVQGFIPKLDLFRDLSTVAWTHRFSGGGEGAVLRALEAERHADLVISTGDLVENGRRGGQWEDFVRRHAALRTRLPYLSAVGNHERTWSAQGRNNWNAAMGPPPSDQRYWYAVDLPQGLGRFVFLDTNILADPKDRYQDSLETVLSNEQLEWADSALAIPATYKIVVLHHPLVTSGHYFSDWQVDDSHPIELNRRARLMDICRRRGVTAVLAGHEHLFLRTYVLGRDGRGFWHITTGGAGSPLYRISKRDRERALAQTLPDSSRVIAPSRELTAYHYCRLVLHTHRHSPGKVEDRQAFLEVYRVRSNGKAEPVERVNLLRLPPGALPQAAEARR